MPPKGPHHVKKSLASSSFATTGAHALDRRRFLALASGAGLALATAGLPAVRAAQVDAPDTVRLDYAYYNPSSLVLRRQGWLEEALPDVEVTWTLRACANRKQVMAFAMVVPPSDSASILPG
jgi:hypothetical protein